MICARRLILLHVLLVMTCAAAEADSLADLRALVTQQDYPNAYALARTMSEGQEGDPEFDFLYGISARRAGHPEVAIFALERVIMQNPKDAISTYERGLALLEVKDLLSAKYAFETVLDLEANGALKSNARKLLDLTYASLNVEKSPIDFAFEAASDVGFNSNANGGRPGMEEFPLQGPEVKDGFANLGVALLMKRNFSKVDSMFLSLASNNRKNFRSQNWDYNTMSGRSGLQLGFGNLQVRIPVEVELVLINYAFARLMIRFGADLSFQWNRDTLSTLTIDARHKGYEDHNDNHFSIPVSLQHHSFAVIPGLDLYGRVSYAPAVSYAANPGRKVNSVLAATVEATYEVAQSHFLIPSIQFNYFRFPVSSQPVVAREDHNILTQLSYEWRFASGWAFVPSFIYTYNASTDVGQNYMRYQAQVGIRYEL